MNSCCGTVPNMVPCSISKSAHAHMRVGTHTHTHRNPKCVLEAYMKHNRIFLIE